MSIQKYESEHATGITVSVETEGVSAELVLVDVVDRNTPVPYFYIAQCSKSCFNDAPLQSAIEKTAFEEIIHTDTPLVSETTRMFCENVLQTGNDIMQTAETNGFKEFNYSVGGKAINIKPCCYDGTTPEYFLTDNDAVGSNSTVYRLASNIVKLDDVEQELEHEKELLQKFYEEKIMPCVSFPYESLTEEEKINFERFSDWHKELYHYRPRGESECRKIAENKSEKKRYDFEK